MHRKEPTRLTEGTCVDTKVEPTEARQGKAGTAASTNRPERDRSALLRCSRGVSTRHGEAYRRITSDGGRKRIGAMQTGSSELNASARGEATIAKAQLGTRLFISGSQKAPALRQGGATGNVIPGGHSVQLAIAKIEQERRYRVGRHHGVIRRIRRHRYVMGDLLRRIRSNLWHRCVAQWPLMHVSSACSTAPQSPRTRASTLGHGPGNVPVLISRQAEKKEKESVPHWGHWVGHID